MSKMIFFSFLSITIIVIPVLINVAFLTLMERKILGISQSRKGPNKVSVSGLTQPFADAIKLFMKELFQPFSTNLMLFIFSPCMSLLLVLMVWSLSPWSENNINFSLSALVFLIVLSLGLYPLLLAGWSSNSKYALMGALRGIAQTISYEISLALILFSFLVMAPTLTIKKLFGFQNYFFIILLASPIILFWFISCVAETNRTPFDFAEGESELVSGFNIEFGSAGFALIFMAEYGSILFLSLFTALLLGLPSSSLTSSIFLMVLIAFMWIWLRSTLPRYRYDKLMNLAWKSILPASLIFSFFYCSILMIFY